MPASCSRGPNPAGKSTAIGGGRPGSGNRSSVFFVAFLPSYRAKLTEQLHGLPHDRLRQGDQEPQWVLGRAAGESPWFGAQSLLEVQHVLVIQIGLVLGVNYMTAVFPLGVGEDAAG